MEGVVTGIRYHKQAYDAQLGQRLQERNFPSAPRQPHFSPRPVSTKYSHLQVVDRRPPPRVPVAKVPHSSYAPGGYADNINVESVLKNQFFAIQGCPQACFVPGSRSDLYNSGYEGLPHSATPEFGSFDPNILGGDKEHFNNATRLDKDR